MPPFSDPVIDGLLCRTNPPEDKSGPADFNPSNSLKVSIFEKQTCNAGSLSFWNISLSLQIPSIRSVEIHKASSD